MLFGWLVEAGMSSNSVLYAKDGVTVVIEAGATMVFTGQRSFKH